jgi:hypothetical protein
LLLSGLMSKKVKKRLVMFLLNKPKCALLAAQDRRGRAHFTVGINRGDRRPLVTRDPGQITHGYEYQCVNNPTHAQQNTPTLFS